MTRKKAPVVAVATAAATPDPSGQSDGTPFGQLRSLFSQLYDVKPLVLDTMTDVPAEADALFVVGPEKSVPPAAQKAIDAFLLRGKSAAFFVDVAHPDVRTFNVTPVDSGLAPLLASYGVKLGDSLVLDVSCAQLTVQEQRGFMRVGVPIHYPFIPMIPKMEGDSVLTRGLTQLTFPFVSAITLEPKAGLQETVLAQSSVKSWLENKPFNTDPRRDWRDVRPSFDGPHPVLVQVTGKLTSAFGGQTSNAESRVIVASGASLAADAFLANSPSNQALLLNVADFLLLDPGMLAMRARGLSEPPLKTQLSEATRNTVKWGNALGIPFLLSGFGLLRWRLRERRRATVTV
jgi:ABC-type uncharacterized transport system involved in gliding motility auxiliary subunit